MTCLSGPKSNLILLVPPQTRLYSSELLSLASLPVRASTCDPLHSLLSLALSHPRQGPFFH